MKFEFDTDELEKKVGDIEGSRSRGVWLVKLAQLYMNGPLQGMTVFFYPK